MGILEKNKTFRLVIGNQLASGRAYKTLLEASKAIMATDWEAVATIAGIIAEEIIKTQKNK